ncbi:MAG: ATP-binding protein [Mycoplasma sp.]
MLIKRDKYLKELISWMHEPYIKVITGVRRCGKSFLLNEIFYSYLISKGVAEDHIIKFDLDNYQNYDKLGKKLNVVSLGKFIEGKIKDDKKYYILLDEIQILKNFYLLLNGLLKNRNLDVYVTGSNSKFLSRDILTEFAGRGKEIRLYPLSFSEYYEAFKSSDKTKDKLLDDYVISGGLPSVVLKTNAENKESEIKNILNEIYLKDIEKRHRVKHFQELKNLFEYLRYNPGTLVSPYGLSQYISNQKGKKIKPETVDRYLSYFEDSFLISRIYRQKAGKEIILSSPYKVYLEDIGFFKDLNHLSILSGAKMENLVYNELRYRGFEDINVVKIDIREINRLGKSKEKHLEVDFVATSKSKKTFYFQSSLDVSNDKTLDRELRSFEHLKDHHEKVLIYKQGLLANGVSNRGIFCISLVDFLLDPDWSK